MYGINISSYQSGINLTAGEYDFAIIKATEGSRTVDPSFYRYALQLTDMKKLIGCYHLARPDIHNTIKSMKEEADNFIEELEKVDLLGKSILILDWEIEPVYRKDLISAWLDRVITVTGVIPIVFTGSVALKYIPKQIKNHKINIFISNTYDTENDKLGIIPTPIPYDRIGKDWIIWHYSTRGQYPKYNLKINLCYSCITERDWMKQAEPKDEIFELETDIEWAVENGIFKALNVGTFKSDEPMTRGEVASIIKRLYELIQEDY